MDEESIFRREALEHHQRGRGPGELIRLSPLWTTWAFLALLAMFAVLVASSLVITLDEDVEAAAMIDLDQGTVVALFPATYSDDLEAGGEMTLTSPAMRGPVVLTIEAVGSPVAPGSRNGLPAFAAPLAASQAQAGVPVRARLEQSDPDPEDGVVVAATAVIHVQDRLLFAVIPGLKNLVGTDG